MSEFRRRVVEEPARSEAALPLLAWTEKHRRIQDRATGNVSAFGLADYPWLREIYERGGRDIQRLVVRKGAQLGVTEYLVNLALWAVDTFGATVFYALPPGGGIVGDFSHHRIGPAISATARLQERATDIDNVGLKVFQRGAIYIRGTHIPQGDVRKAPQLASVPADVLILDELDRIPPAAIPPLLDRMKDSRIKLTRYVSTPSVPGFGIEEEYAKTDMREPHVRCPACGQWLRLDWSLVCEPGEMRCRLCHALIVIGERWQADAVKYMAQSPSVKSVGYWIPGLVSPRADLAVMLARSQSGDEEDVQAFWNNDLGMGYEPKGAKLSASLLEACVRDYVFPDAWPGARAGMGVDVQGRDLHVYIKARLADGKHRALWIGTVPDFPDLDPLMARYDVACCVVDAAPETRGSEQFARRFPGRVFLARFADVEGNQMAVFHFATQAVRVDRTKAIVTSHANIEQQIDALPRDFRFIAGFVDQMTANIRVRTEMAQGQVVYKFPKTGKPDHYDLAKAYCEVAMERAGIAGGAQDVSPIAHDSRWTGGGAVAIGGRESRWKRG